MYYVTGDRISPSSPASAFLIPSGQRVLSSAGPLVQGNSNGAAVPITHVYSGHADSAERGFDAMPVRVHERGVSTAGCAVTVDVPLAPWQCNFHYQYVLGQPLFSVAPTLRRADEETMRRRGRMDVTMADHATGYGGRPPSMLVSPPQLMAVLAEGSKVVASLAAPFATHAGLSRESIVAFSAAAERSAGRMRVVQQQSRSQPPQMPTAPPLLFPVSTAPSVSTASSLVFPVPTAPPLPPQNENMPPPSTAAVRFAPSSLSLWRQGNRRAPAQHPDAAPTTTTTTRDADADALVVDDSVAVAPTGVMGCTVMRLRGSMADGGTSGGMSGGKDARGPVSSADADWKFFGATVRTTPEAVWGSPERWRKYAALEEGVARYGNIAQIRRCVRFIGLFMRYASEGDPTSTAVVAVSGRVETQAYWGIPLAPGTTVGFIVARSGVATDPTERPYVVIPWSSTRRRRPSAADLTFTDASGVPAIGAYFHVGTVVRTFGDDGDVAGISGSTVHESVPVPDMALLGRDGRQVKPARAFERARRMRRTVVLDVGGSSGPDTTSGFPL